MRLRAEVQLRVNYVLLYLELLHVVDVEGILKDGSLENRQTESVHLHLAPVDFRADYLYLHERKELRSKVQLISKVHDNLTVPREVLVEIIRFSKFHTALRREKNGKRPDVSVRDVLLLEVQKRARYA